MPEVMAKFETVALRPNDGASATWRWPEDVEYDAPSQLAIKRYASSLIRRLQSDGVQLAAALAAEAARCGRNTRL